MGLLGALAGGLMAGVGAGMVSDGVAKRDAALREAEREAQQRGTAENIVLSNDLARQRDAENDERLGKREAERDDRLAAREETRADRQEQREQARLILGDKLERGRITLSAQLQAQRDARALAAQYGEVQSTTTRADGRAVAIMRDGTVKDLGFVEAAKPGTVSLTPGDERLMSQIEKRFTTTDEDTGQKEVDWEKVDAELKRRGRADLTLEGGSAAPAAPAAPATRGAPAAPAAGGRTGLLPDAPKGGKTPPAAPSAPPAKTPPPKAATGPDTPPVAGAKKAADGFWYVPDPKRPGKWMKVT